MRQYLKLVYSVLRNGEIIKNRTGILTISHFGEQCRYDLRDGFPLLTTKKMAFNSIVHELLWFISGSTNIQYLVRNNVRIWNEWPYENYLQATGNYNVSIEEFVERIKFDDLFARRWGDLGPIYGKQWRDFSGIDQLKLVVENLKRNPYSRRHIVSAWNPPELSKMLLPPCHVLFQFHVSKYNRLSCQLYQRSADIFLGVPFNIASYALLVHLIANVLNLPVGEFVHSIGDAHIYVNHLGQISTQLMRKPLVLPTIWINPNVKSIFDYKFSDIKLLDYVSYGPLSGKVAV